jgi:uncharacterized damage-inducible protein DinB
VPASRLHISAVAFKLGRGRGRRLIGMEHAIESFRSSTPAPARASKEVVLTLLRYKRWADTELLQSALALPTGFPEREAGYITAIVRHYHTVDSIFRAHLLGISHHYTSPNPTEPATLAELQPRVREIDDWYVDYVGDLEPSQLEEVLNVKFTDGQEQTLRRLDILLHVSQHGTGHRGQASLIMKMCGVEPPPDRITNYLRSVPRDG